jgi:hypothetical protein
VIGPLPLLSIVSEPVLVVAEVGVNVTLIVQDEPASRLVPQVLVSA